MTDYYDYVMMNGDIIRVSSEENDENNVRSRILETLENKNVDIHITHVPDATSFVFCTPRLPFVDWIANKGIDYIDWSGLCANPNPKVADFLESHLDKVVWYVINSNPNPSCVDMLFRYPEHIDIAFLAKNPHPRAVEYILGHIDDLDDDRVLSNNTHPDIIQYLSDHPERIDWNALSRNTCPEVVELFERFPDRVCWSLIIMNKSERVTEFVLKHLDRFHEDKYSFLSSNPNDCAVEYLLAHPHRIQFTYFSCNPNTKAVDALLSRFYNKICWNTFAQNTNPRAVKIVYNNLDKVASERKWSVLLNNGEYAVSYWLQHVQDIRDAGGLLHLMYCSPMLSKAWSMPLLKHFQDDWDLKKVGWIDWHCLFKNPGIFV